MILSLVIAVCRTLDEAMEEYFNAVRQTPGRAYHVKNDQGIWLVCEICEECLAEPL